MDPWVGCGGHSRGGASIRAPQSQTPTPHRKIGENPVCALLPTHGVFLTDSILPDTQHSPSPVTTDADTAPGLRRGAAESIERHGRRRRRRRRLASGDSSCSKGIGRRGHCDAAATLGAGCTGAGLSGAGLSRGGLPARMAAQAGGRAGGGGAAPGFLIAAAAEPAGGGHMRARVLRGGWVGVVCMCVVASIWVGSGAGAVAVGLVSLNLDACR